MADDNVGPTLGPAETAASQRAALDEFQRRQGLPSPDAALRVLIGMARQRDKHLDPTLRISLIMGVLALASLAGLCFILPWYEDKYLMVASTNLLIFVSGWGFGWVAGTLLAPSSKVEEALFQKIAKGIWLFLSGYLLAKIDPIFASLRSSNYLPPSELAVTRIILFAATTTMVMMVVFLARTYGEWHVDRRVSRLAAGDAAPAAPGNPGGPLDG